MPATFWREVPLCFPNRRGRKSAARAVILMSLSTGRATNPDRRDGDAIKYFLRPARDVYSSGVFPDWCLYGLFFPTS
ncbi:hypothetical protein FDW87_17265 [Citrobacter sp. wls826]|nr:hypothetical protein FDW87_17265 [Citrobacter sp. wls826]TKV15271.1 hypothetical protein FDX20_33150 [Citrobacter sp. TBCS-11]